MTLATVPPLNGKMRLDTSVPAAQGQSSAECALALLERSIGFGHGLLAVIRLAMAVDTGADVPLQSWVYCARAAKDSANPNLQAIYRSAAAKVADAVPELD